MAALVVFFLSLAFLCAFFSLQKKKTINFKNLEEGGGDEGEGERKGKRKREKEGKFQSGKVIVPPTCRPSQRFFLFYSFIPLHCIYSFFLPLHCLLSAPLLCVAFSAVVSPSP